MSRPKNEDIGKPLRDQRITVMVTVEEKKALQATADVMGVGASTYIRLRALEAMQASRG